MPVLSNTFAGELETNSMEKSGKIHSSSIYQSDCENNENSSDWRETHTFDNILTEKKMLGGQNFGTPGKPRAFGEEIDFNNIDNLILDTSQISIDTKDTVLSCLTYDDPHSASDSASESPTDEPLGNSSHVANLRGWLNDFGKQNKTHFEKNNVAPPVETLEKPLRPKVARAAAVPLVSVPMVSKYSHSISNASKSSTLQTKKVVNPSPQYYSSSLSAQYMKQRVAASTHPIAPPSALTAAKANVGKTFAHESTNSSTSLKSRVPIRATPIRFKPKIKSEEVQATNEGYASVAKLSAWLADDPTSTKKLKQIRRGANVIAKSRTFDKELVNVVIEETGAPRGGVSRQLELLERCKLTEDSEGDDVNDERKHTSTSLTQAKDWMRLGAPGSDIGISVSDKKKWLSEAFKKNEDNVVSQLKKASTEIVTNRDRYDDVSSRAKQLWRIKHSPMRESNNKGRTLSSPNKISVLPSARYQENESKFNKDQVDAHLFTKSTESTTTQGSILSFDSYDSLLCTHVSPERIPDESQLQPTHHYQIDEDTMSVDFKAARELLVQRSKANGNPVDLSQVQRRKAKFEKMEQTMRRRSSSQLKASWETLDGSIGSMSVNGYVKKYVEDAPPKKSLEQLP